MAIVLWKADLSQVVKAIGDTQLAIFLLAASIHIPCVFIRAARWRTLLAALGCRESLGRLNHAILVGMFLNNFLPSGFGGDAYRAYVLRNRCRGLSGSLASVVVDRILGVFALLLLVVVALVAGVAADSQRAVIWGLVTLVTVSAISAYALLGDDRHSWLVSRLPSGKLRDNVDRFLGALADVRVKPKALAFGTLSSLAVQVLVIVQFYIFGLSLRLPATLLHYALFIPLIMLLLMLPVSIGGFGVREGLFAAFFATIGINPAEAVALAWLAFLSKLVVSVYGGYLMAISEDGNVRWLVPAMAKRGPSGS